MAQKRMTVLIDDITGKELADGGGETVTFSLDGDHYEVDLDNRTAQKLRSALDRYVQAGRRIQPRRVAVAPRRVPTPVNNTAVRAWAASNGIAVSSRGRISASVIAQFEAAGN